MYQLYKVRYKLRYCRFISQDKTINTKLKHQKSLAPWSLKLGVSLNKLKIRWHKKYLPTCFPLY